MGWARNGASAGTAGYAYRLEGIQIRLIPKGCDAPGSTDGAFRQGVDQRYVIKGNGWSFEIPSYWRDKVNVKASTSSLGKRYDFVPRHFKRRGWSSEYPVLTIEERAERVSRTMTFLRETVRAKSGQYVELRAYDMAVFLQADIRSGRSLLIWADTTFPEMTTESYPGSGVDKVFMAGLADLESFGAVKTYDEYMQHYRSDNYKSDCGYEYALARSCLRTLAKGLTIS
jgi:hypothetical protein